MTKKKKPKAQSNLKNQRQITENRPKDNATEYAIFSFKYLDLLSNPKFSIAGCGESYLEKLLLRLRDVSTIRYDDFINSFSPALRSHEIDWSDTTEPAGFSCLNAELREKTAFQFAISSNEYGRVHGFLLERIFYVVWLDPHHRLYF